MIYNAIVYPAHTRKERALPPWGLPQSHQVLLKIPFALCLGSTCSAVGQARCHDLVQRPAQALAGEDAAIGSARTGFDLECSPLAHEG